MVSRMEKYYHNNSNVKKRSQKNIDLYRDIYKDSEYSNIEGFATMDKNNEIDITKIKNTLKNRENFKKQRAFKRITKEEPIEDIKEVKEQSNDFKEKEQQRNYDIRDILIKAKDKKVDSDSPRSLDNTNYNILKNLKLENEKNLYKDKYKDFEQDELKELINTITNTSMLNKMNDEELGLNMFNLEKSEEENASVKEILEEAKKYQEKKNGNTSSDIDDSFFTSSLNFSKEDFEGTEEYIKSKKKRKFLSKFLVFTGLIIMTGIIVFLVYYLIK